MSGSKDADPACRLRAALSSGELAPEDLTARQLGAFLGKTTGHVYHRWGSVDGLLFAISEAGFEELGGELLGAWERSRDLEAVAVAFVEFGLDQPALYDLMFVRRYDWDSLRARGALGERSPGLALFRTLSAVLGAGKARLFFAGLHGLVSLASSGRANVGAIEKKDRDVALESARELTRMLQGNLEERHRDDHRPTAPKRPTRAAEPPRQERHERAPRRTRRRAD